MAESDEGGDATLSVTSFARVVRACVEFEAEFRRGGAPRVEDFLRAAPGPIRSTLLRELRALEKALAESPDPAEFPTRAPGPDPTAGPEFAPMGGDLGGPAPAARPLPTIPGYVILGELGRGAMGVVYQARQLRLNRPCALKMILAGEHASPDAALRFQAEAETVAGLQHPGIVQIYGIGDHGGHPYLELEFLPGGTLARAVNGNPRPPREAASLVASIALAVGEAHRMGVVHRDLKPGNILLTSDGRPKVADFGLAKSLRAAVDLTRTDSVLGSPSYMAPEQAEGRARDAGPAADIYALGAILYYLLTGRPPFRAPTILQTLELVRGEEPVAPTRLQPGIPRDAETICLTCLRKDPARRYSTAEALAEDLRRFLARQPIRARRAGPGELAWAWCRRRPAVAGLLGALTLAVAVGFAAVVGLWRESESHRVEAVRLGSVADSAARQAVRDRLRAQAEASRMALERGVQAAEQGEVGRGVLYLARSLELAPPEDRELRAAIRAKLAHWRLGMAQLDHVLRHDHEVNVARFSPDGRRILTGSGLYYSRERHTARLWDALSGRPEGLPLPHFGAVMDAGFSPDGRSILTASQDQVVRTWDAATLSLTGSASLGASELALSPDGRLLAHSSPGGAAILDRATGRPTGRPIPQPDLMDLDWSPDGRTLITASKDGTVGFWDAATGEPARPPIRHPADVYAASFGPDGRHILAGGIDRIARLWDAREGREVRSMAPHRGTVFATAFAPDGRLAATGSADGDARLVEVATGRAIGQPLPHGSTVWSVAFGPDGRSLATGSEDRTARTWTLPEGYSPARPSPHSHGARAAAFSPDGATILVGDADGLARREGYADGREAPGLSRSGTPIRRVLYRPDGRAFLTVGEDSARLWDAATGAPLAGSDPIHHPRPGLIPGLVGVAFSPDGRRVLTGGSDYVVRAWDAATGRPIGEAFRTADAVSALAFEPGGRRLVTGEWSGHLRLRDAATGQPLGGEAQHGNRVVDLDFHPAGGRFLSASEDGTAQVWDVEGLRRVGPPMTHRAGLRRAIFSPDGRTIATAAEPSRNDEAGDVAAVQLWDTLTGTALGPPLRHPTPVVDLAFRPGGDALMTVDRGGVTRIWRMPELPRDDPAAVMAWARSATGLGLDEQGVIRLLDPPDREAALRGLEDAGGPPFPDHDPAGRHLARAVEAADRGDRFAAGWHRARARAAGGGLAPGDPTGLAHLRLGEALHNLGDARGATDAYAEAARLRPDDSSALFHLGLARQQTDDLAGAIEALRRGVALAPDNATSRNFLGRALATRERSWAPGAWADLVARREPTMALAVACFDGVKRPAGARALAGVLGPLGRAFPGSASIQVNFGVARYLAGDPDGAAAAFGRAAEIDPDRSRPQLYLAAVLAERDRRALQRADPRSIEARALVRLGQLRLDRRDRTGALESFRKAAAVDPAGAAPALVAIASVHQEAGDDRAARLEYARAVELAPSDVPARNGLAWLLATSGDPTVRDGRDAVEHARRAVELSGGKDDRVLDTLAAAHAEAGDFREAVRWQERALALRKLAPYEARLGLYRKATAYRERATTVVR